MTTGPVWEFGCGMYSTPYLHWACYATQRPLVTFEGQEQWMGFANQFITPYHQVKLVTDWAALDYSGECSLALIDHDQVGHTRGSELDKMTHIDYLVLHDANRPTRYGYKPHYKLFKYQCYLETPTIPTIVLSNKHDLSDFKL
jgi:hypothetical protein